MDGSAQPRLALTLTAKIPALFSVEPQFIDFGVRSSEDDKALPADDKCGSAAVCSAQDLRKLRVTMSNGGAFQLIRNEVGASRLDLNLQVRPHPDPGNYHATVTVAGPSGGAVHVGAHLTVDGLCTALPATVVLSPGDGAPEDVSVLIRLRERSNRAAPALLESPRWVSLRESRPIGPGLYTVALRPRRPATRIRLRKLQLEYLEPDSKQSSSS